MNRKTIRRLSIALFAALVALTAAKSDAASPATGSQPLVFTPQQAQQWMEHVKVAFPGIGVELSTVALTDDYSVVITKVIPGTAAEDEHLQPGDRIETINDEKLGGLTERQVSHLLASKQNQSTTLWLSRRLPSSGAVELFVVELKPDIDGVIGIEFAVDSPHIFPRVS